MKKLVSLVLVVAMMAVLATGCGGSSDNGNKNDTQTATETAAENTDSTADVKDDGCYQGNASKYDYCIQNEIHNACFS